MIQLGYHADPLLSKISPEYREYQISRIIPRHHPLLIQVVEELEEKASGECALLEIEEVPAGRTYKITEYDGKETVHTSDEWIGVD